MRVLPLRWLVISGLVGSLFLMVAGCLYARVPIGSWVLTAPVIGDLRRRHDHVAGLVVAFCGLLVLTAAWLLLARRVSGDPNGVRVARWVTLAWILPLLVAPPLFSNDGWSYVATGYLAGHGLSPYTVTPAVLPHALLSGVDPVWRSSTSPYGPVSLIWGALASRGTADAWALLVAHRLLALLGLTLLAVVVPRLARRAGQDPARATALAIASPFVIAHGVGGLHNDLLLAGLVAAAVSVTRRDRWWWGAVLAGVAAAVKVPGGLAAVGVVLLSLGPAATVAGRLGRSVRVALVSLGTLVVISVGSGLGFGWVSALGTTANEPARLAPFAVMGRWVGQLLRSAGPAGEALRRQLQPVPTAKDAAIVLLVLMLAWVLLARRDPDENAAITGAGLAMLAATVLSPALHYWYFLWCVPLLACARLSRRRARALLALVAVLGITAVADPALRIDWLTTTALALLVGGPLIAWLADSPWLPRRPGVTTSRSG